MGEVKRRDEIQGDIIHEYDGIEEADNFLPTWWLITFYGAILFSIGYWFFYHEFQMGPTTSEQYAEDVASQTESAEADEATLVALASDPSAVAAGQETFSTTCAACHGGRGEGLIGPNLTDSAWLHGGSPVEIYTSVRRGISADRALIAGSAGMPEWGPQLGEERTRDVVAFVLSVRGTNEEGGRPPEGDVYGDGATEDGATEDGATEDGATEDGATEDGATEDGATEDGATEDGATEDGATEDGATEDGATEDDATEDGATAAGSDARATPADDDTDPGA